MKFSNGIGDDNRVPGRYTRTVFAGESTYQPTSTPTPPDPTPIGDQVVDGSGNRVVDNSGNRVVP